MTKPSILAKIDRALAAPRRSPTAQPGGPADVVGERSVHRKLQDALSGALREKCTVCEAGGSVIVTVPASVLVSNGVRVAENAIEGGPSILTGTVRAVANAERRIAKLMGEGIGTRLCSYDPARKVAIFTVIDAASPSPT